MLLVVTASMVVGAPQPVRSQVGGGLNRLAVGGGLTNPSPRVGTQNADVLIAITNSGTAGAEDNPVRLDRIIVNPSCSTGNPPPCTTPENLITLDSGPAAGIGLAGTACEGVTFTVTPTGNGNYLITPNSTVILEPAEPGPNPLSSCNIRLTADVNARGDGSTFFVTRAEGTVLDPITRQPQTDPSGNPVPVGGDASQLITILRARTTLVTDADQTSAVIGSATTDTATVTEVDSVPGVTPTGDVTFTLLRSEGGTCVAPNPPIAGSPQDRPLAPASDTTATATTTAVVVNTPGVYYWTASYEGDNNFEPAGPVGCNDPAERVEFTPPPPEITVLKDVVGSSTHAEGDTTPFTFQVTINNTGPNPVTIQEIEDDIYGDLVTRPGSTCGSLDNTVLAPEGQPGSTATCQFTGPFTGPGGASQTDVVTVRGVDNFGQPVEDSDDATVFITNVPPQIVVEKTADPTTIGENDDHR